MEHMKKLACLGFAYLGMATAAMADVVDLRWNEAGHFEHTQPIGPGKFAEVCSRLTKGQAIGWTFRTGKPTKFNIHYHKGKKVEFPAKVDGVQAAEGVLAVELDQDYCWMWTNMSNGSADLTFSAQRQP